MITDHSRNIRRTSSASSRPLSSIKIMWKQSRYNDMCWRLVSGRLESDVRHWNSSEQWFDPRKWILLAMVLHRVRNLMNRLVAWHVSKVSFRQYQKFYHSLPATDDTRASTTENRDMTTKYALLNTANKANFSRRRSHNKTLNLISPIVGNYLSVRSFIHWRNVLMCLCPASEAFVHGINDFVGEIWLESGYVTKTQWQRRARQFFPVVFPITSANCLPRLWPLSSRRRK